MCGAVRADPTGSHRVGRAFAFPIPGKCQLALLNMLCLCCGNDVSARVHAGKLQLLSAFVESMKSAFG
jgi:hypothetical protein